MIWLEAAKGTTVRAGMDWVNDAVQRGLKAAGGVGRPSGT
jgi:hypothetical protein